MRPQHWLYTVPLRLRSLFRGRAVEGGTPFAFQLDKEGNPAQPYGAWSKVQAGGRVVVLQELEPHPCGGCAGQPVRDPNRMSAPTR
jgi:hypothetical protein